MRYLSKLLIAGLLLMLVHPTFAQQSKNILPDMVVLPPSASYSILNIEPLVISQYFDTTELSWVNTRKIINERNSSADLISYRVYDWIDSIWVNSSGFINKLVYTNGKITEAVQGDIVQDFQLNANQFKYTYDVNGKPVFGLISKDLSPIFTGDYKAMGADSFIYVNGNIKRRTIFDIIYDSILVPSTQIVFEYDSLNRINAEIIQNYDVDYEEWIDDSKRLYGYNSANRVIQYTKQTIQDNEWVNQESTTFTYTGNNLMEYTRFTTDSDFAFIPIIRYQYDYNGNLLSRITQNSFYDTAWFKDAKYELNYKNNKLDYTYAFEWDSKLNAWATNPSLRLVYTESRTGLNRFNFDLSKSAFIYPNPNDGQFSIKGIDFIEIKVFGMDGKLIYQNTKQDVYSLPELQPGVYFINVNAKDASFTKKMVISN